MEKKRAGDWHVAIVHFAFAGFFIPAILGFVLSLITIPFLGIDVNGNAVGLPMSMPLVFFYGFMGAAFTFLGAFAGSGYIKRTFIVNRPAHIAMLATVCFVGFAAISDIVFVYFQGEPQPLPPFVLELNSIEWLFDIGIFYFTSKKVLAD